ncbi:MAG: ECF-type sigma factor [Pseudomonadota bacterium]
MRSLQATDPVLVAAFTDTIDLDELLPVVYGRLHTLARSARRGTDRNSTLNTTALVNEAYARLKKVDGLDVGDRHRFFGLCARIMRRILIDHARQRSAAKRQVAVDPSLEVSDTGPESLLAVDRALRRLGEKHPRLVELVEYRFFAGYTQEETAELLGVSDRTVRREWLKAKALLIDELGKP